MRGTDECGRRAFGHESRRHFTHLFSDVTESLRAFRTFVCVQAPDEPFPETAEVTDLVAEDADALRGVLSFFYGLRATIRIVRF
jgi:hypothetical protein